MPTYISLVDWTEEGVANVRASTERLQTAKEIFTSHGGEMTDFFMTMGDHDMVVVSTFPDDASYAKAILQVASGGAVRTRTLKAFTEDEYRDVVDAL